MNLCILEQIGRKNIFLKFSIKFVFPPMKFEVNLYLCKLLIIKKRNGII